MKQWDYIGLFREGLDEIAFKNPLYAKYVCPHSGEIKLIKIDDGLRK